MEYELRAFTNSEISNGALKKGKLPSRLKVLSWGKNETTDGDVFLNDETLRHFDENMEKAGRGKGDDIALDFDHNTVPTSKTYVKGQAKDIAAYGKYELVKGDGLYLKNLEWTPTGKKKATNYKDLSPAVMTDSRGVVVGLHSVALTPNGAVAGLKFYSAKGFDDMINKMSAVEKEGLVIKSSGGTIGDGGVSKGQSMFSDNNGLNTTLKSVSNGHGEYNKDGANAGVKQVGNDKYELVPHVESVTNHNLIDNDETDDENDEVNENGHGIDCECSKCMSIDNLSATKTISATIGGGKKTKTMSANNFPIPDAYRAQIPQYNTNNYAITNMNPDKNETLKKMAAEVGMDAATDTEARILFAFLAKYQGLLTESAEQITKKDNTEEGGLKQFSAEISSMKQEITELKEQKAQENRQHAEYQRDQLIKQASKEGKIIPLSVESLKVIDVKILREMVEKAPKDRVPMKATMRTLSVDTSKPKFDQESLKAKMGEDVAAFGKV